MNRALVHSTLVAGGRDHTGTVHVGSSNTEGAYSGASRAAHGTGRKESQVRIIDGDQLHASNVIGNATLPRGIAAATRPLLGRPLAAASHSNARAQQLAKDTNSSHDDTGARETRRQRDATTA